MKSRVSPVVVVIAVLATFAAVFGLYWKALLKQPAEKDKKGGGGGGGPIPPLTGLPFATVTTVAGPLPRSLDAGESGWVDGPAKAARFDGPSCLAVGVDGTVWVTDSRNHRVRRVGSDGTVTTVAGSGPTGVTAGAFADGPALQARLWNPSGITLAPDGALYVTDTGNHRVRVLAGGRLGTLAGGDSPPDAFGLQLGDYRDGAGAQARFRYPTGIVRTADGFLLVVDTVNRKLRRVGPDGVTATVADLGSAGAQSPCGIALAPDGRVLVADPGTREIFVVAGSAVSRLPGNARSQPFWVQPTALAVGPDGTLYVADTGSHCVVRITADGVAQIVAGVVPQPQPAAGYADGPGDKAAFAAPSGIALDAQGALYVADFGNNAIRRIVIGPEPQAPGSKK